MDKVYIGRVVSTHGIKGELRILSDFTYKDKVFVVGNKLIIDNQSYTIMSYRHHKNYEMVTLDNFKDINEVLFLLKKDVYFNKDDLVLDDLEILDEDLINYKVICSDGREGEVLEIFLASSTNKILRIMLDKEILVPFNSPMVEKIDKKNMIIFINIYDGM